MEAGQKLGTVTLSYAGKDYGTLDLLASSSVERSETLYRIDQAQNFFSQFWVKLALVGGVLLIIILLIVALVVSRNRRRYSGRRRRR